MDKGIEVTSQGNVSFEELALRHELITPEQLEDCRTLRDRVAEVGLECDLEEILLKKNLVTKVQAMAIYAAQGRGNRHAIEGFELLGKLGRGGMGTVYKARQISMDRVVALKVLSPKHRKQASEVERFIREAKAVAQLNHANIVAGIDAGHSNGMHYYAMEFVDGEALSQRITREGTIPWKDALRILQQIGAALEHAHRHQMVHRDVKPANIILAKDGTVKLTDLGMARFVENQDMQVTQSGQVVGTPLYMSPEQARGEPLDIRSDLYALGITLYEMLSGKPPFTGSDPLVVLNKHLHEAVKFNIANVPADVQTIGQRMTEKDRIKRYGSPTELLRDVEILLRGGTLPQSKSTIRARSHRQQRAATLRRSKRNARLIMAGGAGGFALLVLTIGIVVGSSDESPPAPYPVAQIPPKPVQAAPAGRAPEEAEPLTEADRQVLAAYRGVRAYERNNPNDLEEISVQYHALLKNAGGTLYEERITTRARDAQKNLGASIKIQKTEVSKELKDRLDQQDYQGALFAIDRRAPEFKDTQWAGWITDQRAAVNGAVTREAKAIRMECDKAESKGDYAGAIAAIDRLRTLGLPSLRKEAEARTESLRDSERMALAKAEAARKRRADREQLETRQLDGFFEKARQLAAKREYEKIGDTAPKLGSADGKAKVRKLAEAFRNAHEVLAEARQYAIGRVGETIDFQMRGGQTVSGYIVAVQSSILLIGGSTYDVNDMTTASIVALYRTARAAAARPEAVFTFALFERDLPLAQETMRRGSIHMHPRIAAHYDAFKKELAAKARREREEREAMALLLKSDKEQDAALRANTYLKVFRKYPNTTSAPAARQKLQAMAPEVVVHAADLTEAAFTGQLQNRSSIDSPANRKAAMNTGRDVFGPPPGNSHYASFRVNVLAGVRYRCWMRIQTGTPTGTESPANSVYVQFANAQDSGAKPIFRIGTAQALKLAGGTEPGWAWVDRDRSDANGRGALISFASTGRISVRVYGGNDNSAFDQFMLSPVRYFKGAPSQQIVSKP